MLLIAVTSASIGYSVALVSPHPMVTNLVTNLILISLFFSPINYPIERLPRWLWAWGLRRGAWGDCAPVWSGRDGHRGG